MCRVLYALVHSKFCKTGLLNISHVYRNNSKRQTWQPCMLLPYPCSQSKSQKKLQFLSTGFHHFNCANGRATRVSIANDRFQFQLMKCW